jgi:hypothetical protein
MKNLGVDARFEGGDLRLVKTGALNPPDIDFGDCPDLAQTVAVACAGAGLPGTFNGLESLRIKETDRIAALQTELAKIGAQLTEESRAMEADFRRLSAGRSRIPQHRDLRRPPDGDGLCTPGHPDRPPHPSSFGGRQVLPRVLGPPSPRRLPAGGSRASITRRVSGCTGSRALPAVAGETRRSAGSHFQCPENAPSRR